MKHLFYVTSHLTFRIARQIAQKMNIPSLECVLMSARGYEPPVKEREWYSKIVVTQYNVTPSQGRIFAGVKFWQTRRNKEVFDRQSVSLYAAEEGRRIYSYYPLLSNFAIEM